MFYFINVYTYRPKCIYIYLINVYTFRPLNICFISRLNQDSLTPPYTCQTPPHLTSPLKKKKKIHNIISFADGKLGQMHRLTNALNLVVLRKRFPSWPTRTIINHMARLARTPIEISFVVGITVAVLMYFPRFVNQ